MDKHNMMRLLLILLVLLLIVGKAAPLQKDEYSPAYEQEDYLMETAMSVESENT